MFIDIYSWMDLEKNLNDSLTNKNFYETISTFFLMRKIFPEMWTADGFAEWIIKKIEGDKLVISKDLKTMIGEHKIIGSNAVLRFVIPDDWQIFPEIRNLLKQKIVNIYNYCLKREESNKDKVKVEYSDDEKLNFLVESVYKILNHSYLTINSQETFNKELMNTLWLNSIVFYDLETTTTNYQTILWFYFTITNKGELKATFSIGEDYVGGFFEKKLQQVVQQLNETYPHIRTQYRVIDNLYKEQMRGLLVRKDFLLVGYNSLKFDNKVLSASVVSNDTPDNEKNKIKNYLEQEMLDISLDLLEFYKTVGNNSSLDVLLSNNLVRMNKLMSHEELLPMLNKEYLNNKENNYWITKFIYYNTFDVILLALLFFQNFQKDSIWYKNIVPKEEYIAYIKNIADNLRTKQ